MKRDTPPVGAMSDRRRSWRTEISLECTLSRKTGKMIEARTLDIGPGGMGSRATARSRRTSCSSSSYPSTRASTAAPASCGSRATASTRCASRSSATTPAPSSRRLPEARGCPTGHRTRRNGPLGGAPVLTRALQDDDRDLALGLALVVVVGRPLRDHRLPHLGLLVGRGLAGARLEAIVPDLHLDFGVGLEVHVPG